MSSTVVSNQSGSLHPRAAATAVVRVLKSSMSPTLMGFSTTATCLVPAPVSMASSVGKRTVSETISTHRPRVTPTPNTKPAETSDVQCTPSHTRLAATKRPTATSAVMMMRRRQPRPVSTMVMRIATVTNIPAPAACPLGNENPPISLRVPTVSGRSRRNTSLISALPIRTVVPLATIQMAMRRSRCHSA